MTDLSLFVRQELPNPIRPGSAQPARAQPGAEDDSGWAVLSGSSAQVAELKESYSDSYSRSFSQEQQRKVDTMRVQQKTKDSTGKEEINKDNYIDVDVPFDLMMTHGDNLAHYFGFARPQPADNVIVLDSGKVISNPFYQSEAPAPPASPPAPLVQTTRINRRPLR